jgi:beta-glucosidase
LLKNGAVGGKPALPISKDAAGSVLSLGNVAGSPFNGGAGSGSVNMSAADAAALPSLNAAIANIVGSEKLINATALGFSQVASIPAISASIDSVPARQEMVIPQSYFDVEWAGQDISAITFVIGRGSCETLDVLNAKGGYLISDAESDIINAASAFARSKGIPFIVALNMGTWVRISDWEDKADAIIMGWEQGMGGGAPVAKIIFGEANPSGKTPTSVPVDVVGDAPNGQRYNPTQGNFSTNGVTYNEGIFVGYRYYDTYNVPVTYPFGYGLSYTAFDYGDASVSGEAFESKDDTLAASVKITNAGGVAGKEIAQFYIGAPGVSMAKPVKELKGYGKTQLLQPGASEELSVEFDAMSLASYDDATGNWVVEPGRYDVYFAASSKDIRAVKSFTVPSEIIAAAVSKDALAPRVSFDEWEPDRVVATFDPGDGATFQKAYPLYGGEYGYLPELPAGLCWHDGEGGGIVSASTEISADDKTFVAGRAPIEISLAGEGGEIASASVAYNAFGSAQPLKAVLILALYDDAGELLAVGSDGAAVAASGSAALGVKLDKGEAATAKAFLWNADSFAPLLEAASLSL